MGTVFPWSEDYPWINFSFDFTPLHYKTWMALGECGSICTHIENIPLAPEERREMHKVYLAKGVLATTAIEGNTLSEEEVHKAVEGNLRVPESKDYLKQEVENIIGAFNEIGRQIHDNSLPEITPGLLCLYNKKVLAGLPLLEEVKPGEFRGHRVGVGSYRCPPAGYVPEMVGKLCEQLKAFDDAQLDPVVRAVLKAVIAHLYVAWIHPFGDGNGRTARLLEAMILMQCGVPSPAAHLLSNHYNITRTEYYRVLDKAGKTNDPWAFVSYATLGLKDGLREQRTRLMANVWKVVWKNHIYRTFDQKRRTARRDRQRQLALALAKEERPARLQDIKTLNTDIVMLYGNKRSMATLRRDIHDLLKDNLIKMEVIDGQHFFTTNIQSLRFMLPLKVKDNSG
jgi:Fic family protein